MRLRFLICFFLLSMVRGIAQQQETASVPLPMESLSLHLNTKFFVVGENLLFKVYCTAADKSFTELSSIAYVELVGEDGKPLAQIKVRLQNGVGGGDYFFGANVPTGNYTVVGYTKWMRNFDEGNFFREQISVVNPQNKLPFSEASVYQSGRNTVLDTENSDNISAQTDKSEYHARERVSLSVKNNRRDFVVLSASVRLKDSTDQLLKWPQPKPPRDSQIAPVEYLPDARGELITGIITNKTSGVPLSNGMITLSGPSSNFEFLISRTDSSGRFYFNTNGIASEFYLLKILEQDNSLFNIKTDNPFLDNHTQFIPTKLQFDPALLKTIGKRNLSSQVENAFYSVKKDSVLKEVSRARFFNTPDRVYRLDDFTRFPTMDDIFREITPEVVVRQKNENYTLSLRNIVTGERFGSSPLTLIDGVIISNADILMKYDPALIKTVTVVTRHYYYGPAEFDGILNIETYNGNAEKLNTDDFVRVNYIQVQRPKIYYSPKYEKPGMLTRIPDFRTQLYWNPDVNLPAGSDNTFTFFTGDLDGEYLVDITGVDNQGNRVSCQSSFVVR